MPTPAHLPLSGARNRLLRALPPPAERIKPGPIPGDVRRRQQLYLLALADVGVVRSACKRATIARSDVYRWRRDPAFVAREAAAMEDALDLLRLRVHVRAFGGSDALLLMMVRRLLPEFRPMQRTEHVVHADELPDRFSLRLGAVPADEMEVS